MMSDRDSASSGNGYSQCDMDEYGYTVPEEYLGSYGEVMAWLDSRL